ncbi:MAG TPA: hypothetical protein VF544_19145 [Pyrinomonadaceae bacterium]|jgi:hypothetical protein
MKRIRAIFFLSLMLICALASQAQDGGKCAAKLAQLGQGPELYGLHMGMTAEQVKARVPSIEMGFTDASGLSKTSFSPEFHPAMDKAAWAGARTISLEFLDGRVTALRIAYNGSFKWKTMEEFVPMMSRVLGLPVAWHQRPRGGQQLDCSDFQVVAQMIGGSPSIQITDETARQTWEDRQATAAEEEEKSAP